MRKMDSGDSVRGVRNQGNNGPKISSIVIGCLCEAYSAPMERTHWLTTDRRHRTNTLPSVALEIYAAELVALDSARA